ncbi:MAG: translocase [Planctomycetaceae bacterium]
MIGFADIPRLLGGGLTGRRSRREDRLLVQQVRERTAALATASDRDLQLLTDDLRERVRQGAAVTSGVVLPMAFSLVNEAVRRVFGFELYDVQILAGAVLTRGGIAEMATGEGKTLTASLPAFTHALTGEGVHVVTSNHYLAGRDQEELAPVFELLGLSSVLLPEQVAADEKRGPYQAEITYGTGHEFGFDFLRDEIVLRTQRRQRLGADFSLKIRGHGNSRPQMQRGLAFAIVDEADNVLLDDAVSPLLLSESGGDEASDRKLHELARDLVLMLVSGVDFFCDVAVSSISLTERGLDRIHDELPTELLGDLLRPWVQYVEQALRAEWLMRRDVHYVVEEDEVRIVDESTGRIFPDRTWKDGLHQAVEAKERIKITAEKQALARVTRQRFYRMYQGLCGMTGTATGSEREFAQVYGTQVYAIPLRTPSRRQLLPTRSFGSRHAKWEAVADDVANRHQSGQPVLIGTRSIFDSEELASMLVDRGIPFQLLNGRQDAEEAEIIAAAGQVGAVTLATNLAGRGTDIKPSAEARVKGGLHVVATEKHDSARVDRQLVGRAARQGDPGSAQFFVSADDPLLKVHASWLAQMMARTADRHGESRVQPDRTLSRVQSSLERMEARRRQQMLQADEARDQLIHRFSGRRLSTAGDGK